MAVGSKAMLRPWFRVAQPLIAWPHAPMHAAETARPRSMSLLAISSSVVAAANAATRLARPCPCSSGASRAWPRLDQLMCAIRF